MLYTRKLLLAWEFFLVTGSSGSTYVIAVYQEIIFYMGSFYLYGRFLVTGSSGSTYIIAVYQEIIIYMGIFYLCGRFLFTGSSGSTCGSCWHRHAATYSLGAR
jgi:hypothetical protein